MNPIKQVVVMSAVLILGLTGTNLLKPITANALSGIDFKSDRIIDDAIFFNSGSLSVSTIQAFLNSKVPSCDTNGTKMYNSTLTRAQYGASKGYPAPYTCMKDYSQYIPAKSADAYCAGSISAGAKSSAQIIYDVSQACGVSSKVLIVLLQKEQSLVTDDWPWSSQYQKATGYGCPDTAPCDSQYYGFFNQVYNAAHQFKRYVIQANLFNYKVNQTSYIQYNPNSACSGTNVTIHTQATASLYNYTPYQPNAAALNNLYGTGDSCSAYGNRNFWRMYNDWFGSTKLLPNDCDSQVSGIGCVWSLLKSDGSQFLTSSKTERDSAINNFGWIYEGIAFYASPAQRQGTIPTYRLRQNNQHYYTTDQSEYSTLKNSGNWLDEGIAFYVYPPTTSTNMSHKVYRLYNSSLGLRYWTDDENRKTSYVNMGYSLESNTFNGFSGLADLPQPAAGRLNIYRAQGISSYLYTTSLYELETTIKMGYTYEGLLTTANATNSGTPVYRLQRNGKYFYTTDQNERNKAIQSYGMTDEGVGFYLDNTSDQLYRLANTTSGKYLYTNSTREVMTAANTNGWVYETLLFNKNISPSPIYRFLNIFNNRHFYTIDLNEATRITNKGWRYETEAFYADKGSGQPVYRLLAHDKHFYTTNVAERDIAVKQYGYIDEGVAFYVSSTTTTSPVYRLQGGNDEYFFTASSPEKDAAVNKYGYKYEGVGFYLSP
jgi:hypothetical protein